MYNVYSINKLTRERVSIIATVETEEQASKICEEWGWNYCDENYLNYYMEYEEVLI